MIKDVPRRFPCRRLACRNGRRTDDWILRSNWGFALLTHVCAYGGLLAALGLIVVTGVTERLGPTLPTLILAVAGCSLLSSLVGIVVGTEIQRRRLEWYRAGRTPTPAEAHATMRLPVVIALLDAVLWLPGLLVSAVIIRPYVGGELYIPLLLVAASALIDAGLTYLLIDKTLGPAAARIAAAGTSAGHLGTSVLARLAITWTLISGIPLVGLILILTDRYAAPDQRIRGALYIAITGLLLGIGATAGLARAVAVPMSRIRSALQRIGDGDLDAKVTVDSPGEVGMLQSSVNDMAFALRERRRLQEVFGRHVGIHVADRALADDADLSGDIRVVSALFVDVAGSTTLAQKLEPAEFVEQLNRLLTIVVAATDAESGLVNKFEGDAALCIFGAPTTHSDDATAALRADRRIRDAVQVAGEFDIGIGVARGRVFAGDVGSSTRLEYTVIGDPVNEAARLTDEAKHVPQRILVSDDVVTNATPDEQTHWTRYRLLRLRGRSTETASWTDQRLGPAATDTVGAERTLLGADQS